MRGCWSLFFYIFSVYLWKYASWKKGFIFFESIYVLINVCLWCIYTSAPFVGVQAHQSSKCSVKRSMNLWQSHVELWVCIFLATLVVDVRVIARDHWKRPQKCFMQGYRVLLVHFFQIFKIFHQFLFIIPYTPLKNERFTTHFCW